MCWVPLHRTPQGGSVTALSGYSYIMHIYTVPTWTTVCHWLNKGRSIQASSLDIWWWWTKLLFNMLKEFVPLSFRGKRNVRRWRREGEERPWRRVPVPYASGDINAGWKDCSSCAQGHKGLWQIVRLYVWGEYEHACKCERVGVIWGCRNDKRERWELSE